MIIKRRTMAVLGLATVLAGGAGSGMAYASGTGSAPAPTLQAVPGAKPDLSKVVPGIAIPLGAVPHTDGSGTTGAR